MDSIIIKSAPIAISPQKMNEVAGLIRKKELDYSLKLLAFLPKKGGRILHKLLNGAAKNLIGQAIAEIKNALRDNQLEKDQAKIKAILGLGWESKFKIINPAQIEELKNLFIQKIKEFVARNKGNTNVERERLLKLIEDEIAKEKQKINHFYLNKLEVNPGRIQKRIIYRAKGRSDRIRKRYSLIKIQLSRKENTKINNKEKKTNTLKQT